MIDFSEQQLSRYGRQIILPQIGPKGQETLLSSHVAIVGLGGLGSPAAMYLAAAGIGTLTLIDHDRVSLTNLQRQIIHTTQTIEQNKTESAKQTLKSINPDISIHCHAQNVTSDNIQDLLADADVIIEATDNFTTKYLINDSAHLLSKPYVMAGAVGISGHYLAVRPYHTPCYRCLFPTYPHEEDTPTCASAGVLGPLVGIIGSYQASAAIKLLLAPHTIVGQLHQIDVWNEKHTTFKISKNPNCTCCSTKLTEEKWQTLIPNKFQNEHCKSFI